MLSDKVESGKKEREMNAFIRDQGTCVCGKKLNKTNPGMYLELSKDTNFILCGDHFNRLREVVRVFGPMMIDGGNKSVLPPEK